MKMMSLMMTLTVMSSVRKAFIFSGRSHLFLMSVILVVFFIRAHKNGAISYKVKKQGTSALLIAVFLFLTVFDPFKWLL